MSDNRRDFLKGVAGMVGALSPLGETSQAAQPGGMAPTDPHKKQRVRDKLWVWSLVAGMYNDAPWVPGASRMTPAEAALYLGVPNVCMVTYKTDCKLRPSPPYDQYAIALLAFKQVVWALGGAQRQDVKTWLRDILQLSQKYPNVVGIQMDDFYKGTLDGGEIGSLTPNELVYVQKQLKTNEHSLGLWLTLYHHDLKHNLSESLAKFDVVTYWTWEAKDLETLEQGFAETEEAAPHARKVLGCYMWDFGAQKLMPITLMQKQCELGLSWLRNGRIDGMIFGISNLCDLNLEAVEWTRNWIHKVGDEQL